MRSIISYLRQRAQSFWRASKLSKFTRIMRGYGAFNGGFIAMAAASPLGTVLAVTIGLIVWMALDLACQGTSTWTGFARGFCGILGVVDFAMWFAIAAFLSTGSALFANIVCGVVAFGAGFTWGIGEVGIEMEEEAQQTLIIPGFNTMVEKLDLDLLNPDLLDLDLMVKSKVFDDLAKSDTIS